MMIQVKAKQATKKVRNFVQRFVTLLFYRPDFRRNPIKAIWRRIWWRIRWSLTDTLWQLPYANQLKLVVPKSGAGNLVYYQGFSEPDTAKLISRFLRPGMVFFDVGAHFGEYTVLGAHAMGNRGEVHAFEPHPDMFRILETNVGLNLSQNVVLNQCAVSDCHGMLDFEIHAEPSVSALRPSGSTNGREAVELIRVSSILLDRYWENRGDKVDLIKVDVEGAELMVFHGAKKLLALPEDKAPAIIFEYSPENYARFHYQTSDVFSLLKHNLYSIWRWEIPGRFEEVGPDFTPKYTTNLVAIKNETMLRYVEINFD